MDTPDHRSDHRSDHTPQVPTLFVIGDSISIDYGPALEKCLAGMFRYDRLGGTDVSRAHRDLPAGANGGDSAMVLAHLERLAVTERFRPDWLLVNCGLHDIKRDPKTGEVNIAPDAYQRNLERIAVQMTAASRNPVWVRTTPVDDDRHNALMQQFHRFAVDVREYNLLADAVFAARGIPAIDLYGLSLRLGPSGFCDHVHYVEEVRASQAAFIAGHLAAWIPAQRSGAGAEQRGQQRFL
ncbi:MAG: SGNH/GDSL hydrolase family protein [Cytophagales bacterium]|nr:SGNH/GDSL hydrolase family protein [Armatimonadota bacterium]